MSKSQWKVSEERFFYEFLRVAGDSSKEECADSISGILRTKSKEDVVAFYDSAYSFLIKKLKVGAPESNKQRHGLLVKFYDTMVVRLLRTNRCLVT